MLSADKEGLHYQVNAISRQEKSILSGKYYQQTRRVTTIRQMLSADKQSHHYQVNVISRQGESPQAGKCYHSGFIWDFGQLPFPTHLGNILLKLGK